MQRCDLFVENGVFFAVLPIPVSFEAVASGVLLWPMVRNLVSKNRSSLAIKRWKHMILRLSVLTQYQREQDRQAAILLLAKSRMHTHVALREKKTITVKYTVHNKSSLQHQTRTSLLLNITWQHVRYFRLCAVAIWVIGLVKSRRVCLYCQ